MNGIQAPDSFHRTSKVHKTYDHPAKLLSSKINLTSEKTSELLSPKNYEGCVLKCSA